MKSGRPFTIALLVTAALLPAPRAGAQTAWLMDYLVGWYSDPPMINAEQPTTITLWGWFPYDCGQVTEARVLDPSHVEFTLRPGPPCADTVRTWSQAFDLGFLPAGYHTLHIRRSFFAVGVDTPQVAQAPFTFYVEPSATPPPPPPPPCGPPAFPSVLIRCLSGWYTASAPTDRVHTTLVLWGWYPFFCGQVADAAVVAPNHVRLTLEPGPACADTARTWSQPFDLGVLSAGWHSIRVDLGVRGDSCDTARVRPSVNTATIPVYVDDEAVSLSVPNPFVTETRFTVTNAEPGPLEVSIYDLNGRRVVTLFSGHMEAGSREFRWNGQRADGSDGPIGIYFSRVTLANRVVTRRLVMLPR